jgi:hypothetical protein
MLKANHNKDYSVVKTFKAAQVAFFIPSKNLISVSKRSNPKTQTKNMFLIASAGHKSGSLKIQTFFK